MSTPKTSAPVVGFNHNVQYNGRVYHVQTEDSGLPHAHYITHLFVGGNIVGSSKTSYADKAAEPDLARIVRSLMETQHKQMLKRLIAGEFNGQAERLAATLYEPGVLATGQTGPAAVNAARAQPTEPAMGGRAVAPGRAAPAPISRPSAAQPAVARVAATANAQRPAQEPARPASQAPVMQPRAATAPAAARPSVPSAPSPAPVRPPASAPVWQASPPGASTPPSPRVPGAPLPATTRVAPPSRPTAPPRMTPIQPPPARPPPAPERKSAPSLFADQPVEAPHEDLPTLFAEELISERSLDEVILAFLSADLEPPK